MNLQHLKYIVEVEHTGSITKAAENLFMGQPNLSKDIKEMENEIGFKIFKRSAKGVVPTDKGLEFLQYAKSILVQINKIESLYKDKQKNAVNFSILTPRATYISYAVTEFLKNVANEPDLNINIKETNSIEVINSITVGEYNLGIIRFENNYDQFYMSLVNEKNLKSEVLWEFDYKIILSAENKFSEKETISQTELDELIEIIHGDTSVPYLSSAYYNKSNKKSPRQISVYERGSQFDILCNIPNAYMWVSPLPEEVLKTRGLKIVECSDSKRRIKDVLIYRHDYKLSQYDKEFIAGLTKLIDTLDQK